MKLKYRSFLAAGMVTISFLLGTMATEPDKAIKKVPTTHKVVAITFDDGPHPQSTPALLAVLSAKQARATFFMLGSRVERFPALAADVVKNGHELASHSYTHRFPNRLTPEEFKQEIDKSEELIAAVGPKPTLYRPPGGGYNDRLVEQLRQRGYTTVLWSIDPRDWGRRSVEQVVNSVLKSAEPGSIILLHEGDYAASTPVALEIIIDRLREQGYEFVTVSELLQYYEIR